MAGPLHLATRFFGAIRPGPPPHTDERWAESQLLAGEVTIWRRMNNPDRRHAVAVARAVVDELDTDGADPVDRSVVAAALLHDCGKVVSGFRTPARVAATLWWAVAPDGAADRWAELPAGDVRARFAQYRRHPELGAEMLRSAGSERLTYRWAAEHHRPERQWTVPIDIGRVLKACDDD